MTTKRQSGSITCYKLNVCIFHKAQQQKAIVHLRVLTEFCKKSFHDLALTTSNGLSVETSMISL